MCLSSSTHLRQCDQPEQSTPRGKLSCVIACAAMPHTNCRRRHRQIAIGLASALSFFRCFGHRDGDYDSGSVWLVVSGMPA